MERLTTLAGLLPHGKPWDALGETISRLVGKGQQSPFEAVSLAASNSLLEARLAEGWCIILPTFGNDPVSLWVFQGHRYVRYALPLCRMIEWHFARRKYAEEALDKAQFISEVEQFSGSVRELLRDVLDALPDNCPGVLSLQDFGNTLPITAVILGNDRLRARMSKGSFEVRLVPALYPSANQSPLIHPKLVAVIDSNDNLELARAEAEVVARTLDAASFNRVEFDDEAGLVGHMEDATMLIVSTHGMSISNFPDPFLGSLGGARKHAINVATLQRRFVSLPYQLIMLNACHAGATAIDRERNMRTHDAASYPALLLLNRNSVVSAASWRVGDTFSYLHLALVSEGLKERLTPSLALCRAAARLFDLSAPDAKILIEKSRPSQGRDKTLDNLDRAPTSGAFSSLYYVGGIEAFGRL